MEYKYASENTLDYLSLHDCTIENARIEEGNLVLDFEHIDVLETHPLNLYDVAKYTGKSSLIFENFEVQKAFVYDTRDVKKRDINVETDADKIDVGILELATGFEVLDLDEIEVADKYFIFEFGGLSSAKFNNDFAMFIIKFDRVIVCWNELIDDAWFVNFDKN